jgi:hypothetical protein
LTQESYLGRGEDVALCWVWRLTWPLTLSTGIGQHSVVHSLLKLNSWPSRHAFKRKCWCNTMISSLIGSWMFVNTIYLYTDPIGIRDGFIMWWIWVNPQSDVIYYGWPLKKLSKLANSMGQSPYWRAERFPAIPEIPDVFREPVCS